MRFLLVAVVFALACTAHAGETLRALQPVPPQVSKQYSATVDLEADGVTKHGVVAADYEARSSVQHYTSVDKDGKTAPIDDGELNIETSRYYFDALESKCIHEDGQVFIDFFEFVRRGQCSYSRQEDGNDVFVYSGLKQLGVVIEYHFNKDGTPEKWIMDENGDKSVYTLTNWRASVDADAFAIPQVCEDNIPTTSGRPVLV